MKFQYILYLLFTLLIAQCSIAQPGKVDYSVKDKKAIKLYEEGAAAYSAYNLELALTFLKEAIEQNELFIEPHILAAQVYAERKKLDQAESHLERAIAIDPKFFVNNYYFLAEIELSQGKYDESLSHFEEFLKYPVSNDLRNRCDLGMASCSFAINALSNPVPFSPENLGPGVNTEFSEYYPCLTADGEYLLFTREIDDSRSRSGTQEDFFMSSNTNGSWEASKPITDINTEMNEGAPTLSPDGQVLVFTACELDGDWGKNRAGLGSCDLFFSMRIGDRWSVPQNLGEKVNSYYWESQPSYAADGKTIYFIRGRRGKSGYEDMDIWTSELVDNAWQKPNKLKGKVNTALTEESVLIHPDGRTLYFASNGHPGMGGLDIFMSKLDSEGMWGEPINLGYPINTHNDENSLLVSADGNLAFFSSDREGGFGGKDLYQFEMPEHLKPDKVTYAKGEVYDELSYKKLEARFELIDLESGELVAQSYSNPVDGQFLVCLPANRDYALNVSREGYLFYSENFSLKETPSDQPVMLEVPLQKIKPGNSVVLNNVFFDTDQYDLKASSKVELNKLAEFLSMNPALRVEIGGHTDNVGSDADNKVLSENRAKSVVDYLTSKGIDASRLKANGYGESEPIEDNSTESGRSKNRRTEFKVLA